MGAICAEFVNYCEHGTLCFSVLHFELRYRDLYVIYGAGRGSLNMAFLYINVCVQIDRTVILFDRLEGLFVTCFKHLTLYLCAFSCIDLLNGTFPTMTLCLCQVYIVGHTGIYSTGQCHTNGPTHAEINNGSCRQTNNLSDIFVGRYLRRGAPWDITQVLRARACSLCVHSASVRCLVEADSRSMSNTCIRN